MDLEKFTLTDVSTAFKKLKRAVYYDKSDLALRRRLAAFENRAGLETRLEQVARILNEASPSSDEKFQEWIEEIRYRVAPKKLESERSGSHVGSHGTFISNVTSAASYSVSKVNYFFDGPIELQLIAVLWLMNDGIVLDGAMGGECYGARLERTMSAQGDKSPAMYSRYHELYKKWRDGGIWKAKQMLTEENTSVCVLGLDIQEYYYHVDLDYAEVSQQVKILRGGASLDSDARCARGLKLMHLVERISQSYRLKINHRLLSTHPDVSAGTVGLPIGLITSPLLANWYLRKFDFSIRENVRPAYYGRYVDDIFIVVAAPANFPSAQPVDDFIRSLLVKTGVLQEVEGDRYQLIDRPGLFLQKKKCILQHFDVHHSIAGLEKFQKKLEANGSDFLLLPVEEEHNSLEDVAYELLYDGSVNKFRSVKGVAENRYELAKYLAGRTMLHLLTDGGENVDDSATLINFFKGHRAIEFHDLWERVLTFLVVSQNNAGFARFCSDMKFEIERVDHVDKMIAVKVKRGLLRHLDLSVAMAKSLTHELDSPAAKAFRSSNLVRHHFVRTPLANYTNFDGSLLSRHMPSKVRLMEKKAEYSPRHVNFDECMLIVANGCLSDLDPLSASPVDQFERARRLFETINRFPVEGIDWMSTTNAPMESVT